MNLSLIREVLAQGVGTTPVNPLNNTFGTTGATLAAVFGLVINVVIGVGIALTVIFLVLGGIKYVTSQGDPKAADAARQALTNAIIGFVVVLGAITIRWIVGNLLGADTDGLQNVSPF
jgi:hypothetical protein